MGVKLSAYIFTAFLQIVVQEDGQILSIFGVQIEKVGKIVLDCALEVFVVGKRVFQEGVKLSFELQEVLNYRRLNV